MNKTSKKYILTIGIGFFSLFIIFLIISSIKNPINFELKKATYPFPQNSTENITQATIDSINIDEEVVNDSTQIKTENINSQSKPDSINGEKVLLIGDSQLEGLRSPIYNYCITNNHQLIASILWYGSSTKLWGQSDTLKYFLKKYKPTYLIIAIGLNELFVNDMDNRRTYINSILTTVKKFGVRYFWIGPAAWKKDKGITSLLEEMNGKYFYPSHKLKLDRAKDKMHPSRKAARIWVDSVAVHVSNLKNEGLNLTIRKDTVRKIKKDSPLIIIEQEK